VVGLVLVEFVGEWERVVFQRWTMVVEQWWVVVVVIVVAGLVGQKKRKLLVVAAGEPLAAAAVIGQVMMPMGLMLVAVAAGQMPRLHGV